MSAYCSTLWMLYLHLLKQVHAYFANWTVVKSILTAVFSFSVFTPLPLIVLSLSCNYSSILSEICQVSPTLTHLHTLPLLPLLALLSSRLCNSDYFNTYFIICCFISMSSIIQSLKKMWQTKGRWSMLPLYSLIQSNATFSVEYHSYSNCFTGLKRKIYSIKKISII